MTELHRWPIVSVDYETTGTYWYRDRVFGVAIAVHDPNTGAWDGGYWDLRKRPEIIEALKWQLPQCKTLVNHAAKFEMHFSENLGFKIPQIQCTMVRAALIDENRKSYSLDSLGKDILGEGKVDIYEKMAAIFGGTADRKTQMANLHRAPEELVAEYATPDPQLAIKLWLWQEQQIKAQELERVWELERRLTPVLQEMERHGVRINVPYIEVAKAKMDDYIQTAQNRLNRLARREINVNSSPQMRALFSPAQEDGVYRIDGLRIGATGTGVPSIDKDVLLALEEMGNPLAKEVLTVRRFIKAKSFLDNHILEHLHGDRVHPNYNQTKTDNETGTITGRLSVDDPALQQIPKRDAEVASIVRAAFIPEQGHEWMCCDWDQFEFRWFAHYVKSGEINAIYQSNPNADFHQVVADLTGLPRDADGKTRSGANAKQLNLGMVFGMGKGLMAQKMGLPYTVSIQRFEDGDRELLVAGPEALEKFAQYHRAIPGIEDLLKQASSIARSRGYVITAGGRHLRFPGGKFTHKAGGLVFQGTSADCMKIKMIELHEECKNRWPLLLSVHDETDASIPVKEKGAAKKVFERILTDFGPKSAIPCRIPIKVGIQFGANWWEGCK